MKSVNLDEWVTEQQRRIHCGSNYLIVLWVTLESLCVVRYCGFEIPLLSVAESTIVVKITVAGHEPDGLREVPDSLLKV